MFGSGAPKCPRCSKSVYANEAVLGAGAKWHNTCFNCKTCKTGLSSTTLTDKDGEIYCAPCYAKNWGPKGFGIGGALTYTGVTAEQKSGSCSCGAANQTGKFCSSCGAALGGAKPQAAAVSAAPKPAAAASASAPSRSVASLSSAYAKPAGGAALKLGGGDICGKCGKAVYSAEKVIGAGKVFHNTCFRCTTCGKGLDSTNVTDKDGTLYCTTCYGKSFGPKGYGYAGGGATTFAST